MISVSFCLPDQVGEAPWNDLLTRSTPNVFVSPVALKAALDTRFADVRVLLAWKESDGPAKLVGLWALRLRKIAPFWPMLLEGLPYDYAFLSNPVVDPVFITDVLPAFLAAIAASTLPKILSLRDFDVEAPSYGALVAATAANGNAPLQLAADQRPVVSREFGVKKSGSTRKKLRQDWNRLSALGAVEVDNARAPEAVRLAFETFLAMEAQSWKGDRGTALLSRSEDAAFVRQLIGNLAEQGRASVALLKLGNEVIAAQVLMYCGRSAYTWKTAYLAEYGKYSPGSLLVDKVTEQLLATPGIDAIDSCSTSDGFMAQLWAGRRSMVDLLVAVGPGTSGGFQVEAARRRGLHELRNFRNLMRGRYKAFRQRNADKSSQNYRGNITAATRRARADQVDGRDSGDSS
jgi:hypothetical protein